MKLFEEFPKSGKQDWINLLAKELKGADFDSALIKHDTIEEVDYPSFFHGEDAHFAAEVPGKFPYRRGFLSKLNDWSIAGEIAVDDEKKANKLALDMLMKGNTALIFNLENKSKAKLDLLFQGIGFEFIKVFFRCKDRETISALNAWFEMHPSNEIFLAYNPLAQSSKLDSGNLFNNAKAIFRNFEVDAYSIQQSGASCAQEIAFALGLGHEYLAQQLELGRSVDDALLHIHFTPTGRGSRIKSLSRLILPLRNCQTARFPHALGQNCPFLQPGTQLQRDGFHSLQNRLPEQILAGPLYKPASPDHRSHVSRSGRSQPHHEPALRPVITTGKL